MSLKMNWKQFLVCCFGMLAMSFVGDLQAKEDHEKFGTGLKTPTKEEWEELEKMPKVRKVHPNKMGKTRSQPQLLSQGTDAAPEIQLDQPENVSSLSAVLGDSILPAEVDNSKLPCFPRIGNQTGSGACTAFGSTYYQATHEIGLLNGYNNKLSANVLSPKWTYNMINGGKDAGSSPLDAYKLLALNGAVTNSVFPFSPSDPYSWDLNGEHWIAAMSNRTTPAVQVPGIGGASQDLTQIKQLLANGHVLTFGTYAGGWQYTTIKNNLNPGADNRFVGQKAIHWVMGMTGAHFATIVGYNDNIWIDVNGNGKVDPGEMGAFLVANSWGTGWGNAGYIWISYDAFLNSSAVPNGNKSFRTAAANTLNHMVFSITGKAVNYKPSMIAQFNLTSGRRNQFAVSAGISTPMQMNPNSVFTSGALNHQGGIMGFDGSQTTGTGTFALDLTDLVAAATPDFTRFYLITNDNLVGYPTTLNSFSLIDKERNITTSYNFLPRVIDNKTATIYVDNPMTPPPPPPVVQPVVAITSPTNQSQASGLLPVSATVTVGSSSIVSVTFYVDNVPMSIDTEGPYTFLLNTLQLTNGMHRLLAKVVDTQGNSAENSILIFVSN